MIANKYTILSKIGEGNFSTVYKGSKKNEDVAIKFENENSELKLLKHETSMLNYLYSKGSKQTPYVYFYGLHQNISTLIIPYYECSLEDYCENNEIPNNWFITMLETLHVIHHLGVIHRDIKPQNFMIKQNSVYLIDFGLSTIYIDDDYSHVPEKHMEYILGTPKFISIHVHNGISPSRRDDLISLMYIYSYIKHKVLLWSNVSDEEDEYQPNHILHNLNQKRKQLKDFFQNNVKDFEKKIMDYVYSIDYKEQPHYHWLISIFEEHQEKKTNNNYDEII